MHLLVCNFAKYSPLENVHWQTQQWTILNTVIDNPTTPWIDIATSHILQFIVNRLFSAGASERLRKWGGGYKFVRTLYNLVVKFVCLKFWHKPNLWLRRYREYKSWTWGYNVPPCPHSSDATGFLTLMFHTVVWQTGKHDTNIIQIGLPPLPPVSCQSGAVTAGARPRPSRVPG